MSDQQGDPPAGLQDMITEVLQGLYTVGGYASITWRLDDQSLISLTRAAHYDEPVVEVTS